MPSIIENDSTSKASTIHFAFIADAIKTATLGNSCSDVLASVPDASIVEAISQLEQTIKKIIQHVNLVAQGRYDTDFVPTNDADELGFAISDMTEMLREISRENGKSAWIKSGQAELLTIMRGDQNPQELAQSILSFLVRYTNAMMGTFYQIGIEHSDMLELIATFALRECGRSRQVIYVGEGLIGQCAEEKELMIFSDVPAGYMTISTSLGEVDPKHIILTPFLIDSDVVGVMELGAMETFDSTKLELLRQVSRSIAIALKSAQQSEKIKIILGGKADKTS